MVWVDGFPTQKHALEPLNGYLLKSGFSTPNSKTSEQLLLRTGVHVVCAISIHHTLIVASSYTAVEHVFTPLYSPVHTSVSGLRSARPTAPITFCLPTKTVPTRAPAWPAMHTTHTSESPQSTGYFIAAMGAEPSLCRPAERWAHEGRRNVHTRCFIASANLRDPTLLFMSGVEIDVLKQPTTAAARHPSYAAPPPSLHLEAKAAPASS